MVETLHRGHPRQPEAEDPEAWPTVKAGPAGPAVEVRYSPRRKRRASARLEDGRILVDLPASMDRRTADAVTRRLVDGLLARRSGLTLGDAGLAERAMALADRYLEGVRPRSVTWSPRQWSRWGSCSLPAGDIRLSERLRPTPPWVIDAVLVHELAHLLVPDHGPGFHRLTARYERSAEARFFLDGFALGLGHGPT
ncbi:MAG TPA: M48 family metallopeptidase [Acidimicrobiales bacterium]|nr:M48 family metallopeptidase [Acidimicrobiales bacterium]